MDKIIVEEKQGKPIINKANENAIVMHCLPAYRSKEITDQVIDSKKSRIFEQAENRLHVQQALLANILHEHDNNWRKYFFIF